jgi:predicted MFS family arabinose efflux permease
MPLRIFANCSRSGAFVIMLLVATAMFGVFFFLTIFVQDVLGYSPLLTGVAFLPFAATLVVISGLAGQLVTRVGARPPMLTGTAATSGGMYWFSSVGVHTSYASGLLGPSLLTGAGLGLLFVPLSLVALTRVGDQDSGLASSLLNTSQQVGGAIGLAALGTVAWTAYANSARSQIAAAGRSGHALASAQVRASVYHHALAAGITRGFLAASGIALAALVLASVTIWISREDLASPAAAPAPGSAETAMEPDAEASQHRWLLPRGGAGEASHTPKGTPPR